MVTAIVVFFMFVGVSALPIIALGLLKESERLVKLGYCVAGLGMFGLFMCAAVLSH